MVPLLVMFTDISKRFMFTLWYTWCRVISIAWSVRWYRISSRFCMPSLVFSAWWSIMCSPIWISKCSFWKRKKKSWKKVVMIRKTSNCMKARVFEMCPVVLINFFCVGRSHQPFSGEHRKPCGVGLEAKVMLTRCMSCEGKLWIFTIAFGHLKLDKQTNRTLFRHNFMLLRFGVFHLISNKSEGFIECKLSYL